MNFVGTRPRRKRKRAKKVHLTFEIIDESRSLMTEGDLIKVHETDKIATWDDTSKAYLVNDELTSKSSLFMHIKDTTATSLSGAKHLLNPSYFPPTDPEDPYSGGLEYHNVWCFVREQFSLSEQDRLMAERQGTYTWQQAKTAILNKVTGQYIKDEDLF